MSSSPFLATSNHLTFFCYVATFQPIFLNMLILFYHATSFISILGSLHKQRNTVIIEVLVFQLQRYFILLLSLKDGMVVKDFK